MAKKAKKPGNHKRKKPTLTVRLSQCMIVKNEEEHIEQALSWGKGIVWEQIVVDTGSTDRTVELAKKMGAKVFHFTWNDDFSAAKNYAIGKAKGDWIAFLDADEWFSKEDAKKLLPLIAKIHFQKNISVVRSKLVCLDEDGGVTGAFCQDRIFRRDPKLRYRYRIHEELYRIGTKDLVYEDAQEDLMILHSGYAGEGTGLQKGERNARLLEQDLNDHPKDAMRMTYLADAYNAAGRKEEALRCYRKVLEDPEMEMTHVIAPLRSGLQIMGILMDENPDETGEELAWIRQKLLDLGWDMHPDLDYFMGCWQLRKGLIMEAAVFFERALEKVKTYHERDIARITSNLEFVNRIIATAALLNQNPQKAVPFAVAALQVNRYSADAFQLLLRAFLSEWEEGMSAEPYWQFLSKLYDTRNLKDLLFVYNFTGTAGFEALQAYIWNLLPQPVQRQLEQQNKDAVCSS